MGHGTLADRPSRGAGAIALAERNQSDQEATFGAPGIATRSKNATSSIRSLLVAMPCAPSSVLVTTSSKAAPSSVRSLLVDALIVADLYLDAFALSSNGVLDHGLLP